jgi:hypothetical protein
MPSSSLPPVLEYMKATEVTRSGERIFFVITNAGVLSPVIYNCRTKRLLYRHIPQKFYDCT